MTDLTAHEARLSALCAEALSIADEHDDLGETNAGNPYIRNHVRLARAMPRLITERDEARALVEQMREALREEVKKRHHYTDGSQPNDAWLDAKIAEMYPALAAVPDPEEPEKVVGGPGDDGDPHGEDPGIPPTREYLAVPDPEEDGDAAGREAFNAEVEQGVRSLENRRVGGDG